MSVALGGISPNRTGAGPLLHIAFYRNGIRQLTEDAESLFDKCG